MPAKDQLVETQLWIVTHMHRVVVTCSAEGCQTTEQSDRLLRFVEAKAQVLAGELRHNREAAAGG